MRDTLLDAALIKIDQNGAYILGRDLQHYSLCELCALFRQLPVELDPPAPVDTGWLDRYQRLLANLHAQNREQLQLPLAELFATPAAEQVGAGARTALRASTSRQPPFTNSN